MTIDQKKKRGICRAVLIALIALCAGCRAPESFSPAPRAERTVEIGMLLRKQFTTDIREKRPYRHIDILFPDGEIFGFNTSAYDNSFAQNVLFNSRGEVRTNPQIWQMRRHYIDRDTAKNFSFQGENNLIAITDWARFYVTPTQSVKLRREWEKLAANPPEFRLLGKNCATRAMENFVAAGILPKTGIPGLDRPENLREIVKKYYPEMTVVSGYFWLDENNHPQIEIIDIDD